MAVALVTMSAGVDVANLACNFIIVIEQAILIIIALKEIVRRARNAGSLVPLTGTSSRA